MSSRVLSPRVDVDAVKRRHLLADENGAVVIPRDQLDEALEGGMKWLQSERAFLRRFEADPALCYPDFTGATGIVERSLAVVAQDRQ